MESQPRDEWEVDEERGGMAMKRTLSPKEREVMKRII
jgi:FixJ family two-component response regulator